jgi:hypothetical protein
MDWCEGKGIDCAFIPPDAVACGELRPLRDTALPSGDEGRAESNFRLRCYRGS